MARQVGDPDTLARFDADKTTRAGDGIRLSESVHAAIEEYFAHMEGNNQDCDGLYAMVLSEVERPLLKCVMRHCQGNRTLAAKVLGINRATLRKKLDLYHLD